MEGKDVMAGQVTAEEAARRKLAEMNLLDDFLFGSSKEETSADANGGLTV